MEQSRSKPNRGPAVSGGIPGQPYPRGQIHLVWNERRTYCAQRVVHGIHQVCRSAVDLARWGEKFMPESQVQGQAWSHLKIILHKPAKEDSPPSPLRGAVKTIHFAEDVEVESAWPRCEQGFQAPEYVFPSPPRSKLSIELNALDVDPCFQGVCPAHIADGIGNLKQILGKDLGGGASSSEFRDRTGCLPGL